MALNQEVELKLELVPQAADVLEQSAILPPESSVEQLHATYFDTPARTFHAHGLSLRIRQSNGGRVQTVKAGGTGGNSGLFARAEWEMPISGDEPVIDSRTPIAAVLNNEAAKIGPIFHVEVSRRTWLLSRQDATIEIAMDRGRVRAAERETVISEIELELKSGDAAALFALARRIGEVAAVRLGVLTKSERGYRLLDAAQPALKAEAVGLDPSMDTRAAFRAIVEACLKHYRLNENLLLVQYEPHALHQARVAVRRLRSGMSIFKPLLVDGGSDRFRGELRWLAAKLGRARDLDVLSARADVASISQSIQQARLREHDEVGKLLKSQKVRALWMDLLEWLHSTEDGPVLAAQAAPRFARKRLDHYRRRIAKRGRNMEELSDEERHEIRKDAKKLRYASEFFVGLFDDQKQQRRWDKFINALEALQDDLGALNDLVSAPDIFTEHGLSGWHMPDAKKQRRKLISAAAEAHGQWAEAKRFWR